MGWLGFAIWYMDDGCTYVSKSKKDYQATISTYTSKKEAETLIKFFKDKFDKFDRTKEISIDKSYVQFNGTKYKKTFIRE